MTHGNAVFALKGGVLAGEFKKTLLSVQRPILTPRFVVADL